MEWTGAKITSGYGTFRAGSSKDGSRRNVTAHRYAYEFAHETDVPDGLYVLHRCDNKLCVNPDHLYAGTPRQNMLDIVERKACKYHSKLTAEQAAEIRASTERGVDLAKRFGVTPSAICNIRRGKKWTGLHAQLSEAP